MRIGKPEIFDMTSSISSSKNATAVVVGLCSHGLATVRALEQHGVEVHAVESNARLPGAKTRCATVHIVDSIVGAALIDALKSVKRKINSVEKPVLFVMSDRMVEVIAAHVHEIESEYHLSWMACRDWVMKLQSKSNLADYCAEREMNYPKSWLIHHNEKLGRVRGELSFPLIAKPSKPLGRFKVKKLRNMDELTALLEDYASDLPIILQQWIEGGDESLYFSALYLDAGRVVTHFEGRKLRSMPPALGHTTIAAPVHDEEIFQYTVRFFAGTGMSGAVSLEIKRDQLGKLWVIEPTVGRTDFWLACCTQNGVNIPYTEYMIATGQPIQAGSGTHPNRKLWYDTERDPLAFLRYALGKNWIAEWRRATFPYLAPRDMSPFWASMVRDVKMYTGRAQQKLGKLLHRT